MEDNTANAPSIVEVAKKKRHIYLLSKIQSGKNLTRAELKELKNFEHDKMPEGCVDSQVKVARLFAVSERTVNYWIREGMPVNNDGTYNIAAIQEWRYAWLNRKKKKDSKKIDWDEELKRRRALKVELEIRAMRKELIPRREAEREILREFGAIKQRLLGLPRIIAVRIRGLTTRGAEHMIRRLMEEVINDFSGGKFAARKKSKAKK